MPVIMRQKLKRGRCQWPGCENTWESVSPSRRFCDTHQTEARKVREQRRKKKIQRSKCLPGSS